MDVTSAFANKKAQKIKIKFTEPGNSLNVSISKKDYK